MVQRKVESKLNICMFSPFSSKAPCALRLLSFGRELVRKGHRASVVLPSFDRHSNFLFESYKEVDGVELIRPYQFKSKNLEVSMAPYVFSTTLKALSLTCDVIHVQKPSPLTCPGYLAKMRNKTPLVQDIDDLDHAVMIAEKHPRMRIWVIKQFERVFPKFADHIVTCSSYLQRIYENIGIEKDKITWISYGVDASEFDVKPHLSIKENYGLRDKVIVYVGSLNIETHVSLLIRSIKSILREKDVSCLIIGDGRARPYLERLVDKLNLNQHVIFTGRIPHVDVPKFLSISDIGYACFPRIDYIEAASNIKVFEYMASGIPPVVSPVGDFPYYVDFGKAGVIAEYNIEDVSRALLYLLDDEKRRKRFGEHARKHVRKNFDWQVLTERLLSVYEKLQEQ